MRNHLSLGVLTLVLLALPAGAAAQDRLLFVGNSYTFYSGGLQLMVDALLEESTGATVDAQAITAGGYRLVQHLADADGSNGDRPLRQALVTGGDAAEWNLVVLQAQSQIPGFPRSQIDWIQSRDAAVALDELIEPTGAHTMFFMTWGRRDGDSRNPARYPDFRAMQELLSDGYLAYQTASSSEARPTFLAPVGPAFELVYDDVLAEGRVPEEGGSSFYQLYAGDGSHPSEEGTYLSACVFFAAYSGVSPVGLEWAPAGVDSDRREYLQTIAAEAVFELTEGWPYPWEGDVGTEDVGTEDVGTEDVGTEDVGTEDVGEEDTPTEPVESDSAEGDAPSDSEQDLGPIDAPAGESGGEDSGELEVNEDLPDGAGTEDAPRANRLDTGSRSGGSGGCVSAGGATSPRGTLVLIALVAIARRRRRSS